MKTCRALGKTEEADKYQAQYERIVKKFQQTFLDETGVMKVQTQTAHILALYFDLLPETGKAGTIEGLKRLLAKEILDGNFGEIAGNVFRSMSSKEQEILLGGWLNSFRTGSVLPVFLDMVHGLVADSIVYHNNAYPDEILIYTGWKRERNLEQRIRFLIDTFLDIRYRVEIFYEYHFGIIGVEETMRIGEIAIC